MSAARLLLAAVVGFVIGIPLPFLVSGIPLAAGIFIGAALVAIGLFIQWRALYVGVFVLGAVLGIVRTEDAIAVRHAPVLEVFTDTEQTVAVTGRVVGEVVPRGNGSSQFTLAVTAVKHREMRRTPPHPERVRVTARTNKVLRAGDIVLAEGQLHSPPVFDGFNYRRFLRGRQTYAVMYYPQVSAAGGRVGAPHTFLADVRAQLAEYTVRFIPPPSDELLRAMVLGQSGRLSEPFEERLSGAGIRHIAAISGMHVSVMSLVALELLLGIGLWRRSALMVSLVLLILYIALVGAPPSAVRAGIMGGLVTSAYALGRTGNAGRGLVFAAAGMLAANPFIVQSDVGFRLSFAATAGIIYGIPFIERWLRAVPERVGIVHLRALLAMTISAQIATSPLLFYHFDFISPAALLTNILVVPVLPLLLMGSITFFAAAALWQPLAWLVAQPVWLLFSYVVIVAEIFSQMPFSQVFAGLSWQVVAVVYGALTAGVLWLRRRFCIREYRPPML